MKKRYDMGGSLQQLLPLLDLAAPGLGTAASTVAGVLQQANAFNKQTTPLKSPTNPFRSYRDGGLIKVGNNEALKININDTITNIPIKYNNK